MDLPTNVDQRPLWSRALYGVADNLSFVGEVVVDFLGLNRSAYQDELDAYRRKQRALKRRELEELQRLEETPAPGAEDEDAK